MGDLKITSKKFNILWEAAERLLEQAEPREVAHTEDMIKAVLECRKILKYSLSIFLPLAILHNIERVMVLKEYFNDAVITAKLQDGKIVRLSPAENVVKNLLESIGTSTANVKEILSVFKVRKKARRAEREGDSKKAKRLYNTDNKKLFHDLHLISRFNSKEINAMKDAISDRNKFEELISTRLDSLFNHQLRIVAEKKLRKIEGIKEEFVWGEH